MENGCGFSFVAFKKNQSTKSLAAGGKVRLQEELAHREEAEEVTGWISSVLLGARGGEVRYFGIFTLVTDPGDPKAIGGS